MESRLQTWEISLCGSCGRGGRGSTEVLAEARYSGGHGVETGPILNSNDDASAKPPLKALGLVDGEVFPGADLLDEVLVGSENKPGDRTVSHSRNRCEAIDQVEQVRAETFGGERHVPYHGELIRHSQALSGRQFPVSIPHEKAHAGI